MTDIETIVEEIIREAAGKKDSSVAWKPDEGETKEQWEEIKESLKAYGTVIQLYDGDGSIKFTVSEQGRAFLTMGGFKQLRHDQELREKEVEATVSAADSAKKSAAYAEESNQIARKANRLSLAAIILAAAALAVSIISLVTKSQ